MGWFDNQIQERKAKERELLSDSFENISRSVIGHKISDYFSEGADVSGAVSDVLKYFNIKEKEIPAKYTKLRDKLDFLLSSSGVLYREAELEKGFRNDAYGVFIATLKDNGDVVALIPDKFGAYRYFDHRTGKSIKVTARTEKNIEKKVLSFYKPFPQRKLTFKDVIMYMTEMLNVKDYLSFGIAALCVTLVGIIIPKLNSVLIGPVIENSSYRLLFAVSMFMVFATLSRLLFTAIRFSSLKRISDKFESGVRAASMMRIFSLPASFFKDYSSGELNEYLGYLISLCDTIVNSVFSSSVTAIFSFLYITQIFKYAPSLVVPSLVISLSTVAISVISALAMQKRSRKLMEITAKERGFVYNIITGIQKIRLSGAENRAFAKWATQYSQESEYTYNNPVFIKMSNIITTSITLIGVGVMYFIAVKNGVSVSQYYAFNASYAYLSSAFTALAGVAITVSGILPSVQLVKPLLEAEPELKDNLETVSSLSGGIELSHVSFRYEDDSPYILNDVSLTISPRQYVAIVGKSGCGKSTLMRLLLGFEMPNKGSVYYDKRDTRRLDMGSVRRQIGTVMQDCKVFGGSIFENIAVSAPTLTLRGAWEAAEAAGIADDIRAMPMKMNTMLQEGSGGVSGGQRQRLMIARAVAPKPKILMFDEATSALDNITQKIVSESLDSMKCTRIVIAHRLSTIRHCDRIIVLDKGKIIEDGTYDALIEKNGFFADLVKRQQIDME